MVAKRSGGWQGQRVRGAAILLLTAGLAYGAEPIAESEVRDLLHAWLAAQNDGVPQAYNTLYAKRFFGIKRASGRTYHFDRAGWLKDRGRMFRRKMQVQADDVSISTASARTAVLRFTQTWASGSFKDRGPKQLVVVREGGALRIAREEMLASERVGPGHPTIAAPGTLRLLLTAGGRQYVVIADGERMPAAGATTLLERGGEAVVTRAAAELRDFASWKGSRVTAGSCTARVEEVLLLSGFEPHFGTRQHWDGTDPFEPAKPLPDAQVADEVWSGGGPKWLVGRLATPCPGALWAESGERTGAPLEQTDGAPPGVLKRFRALPGYRAIQNEFPGKGPWDGGEVRAVTFRGDGVRYHALAARAGEGCGAFEGSFWAIFEDRGAGPVLLTDPKAPGEFFLPRAAADVGGDGAVDFFAPGRSVQRVEAVWRETRDVRFPSFDCPC